MIPRRLASALAVAMLAVSAPLAQSRQPTPTFRAAIDLIPVDVAVVDRQGHPVTGLGPAQFEVTLDGRRHRVVSAQLLSYRTGAAPDVQLATLHTGSVDPGFAPAPGRTFVLAIDCLSFDGSVSAGVVSAARAFVARLAPGDRVGLYAYPLGPKIDPTLDHGAVRRALADVVGQRSMPPTSRFNLRPADVVDLTGAPQNAPQAVPQPAPNAAGATRRPATESALVQSYCPRGDAFCAKELNADAMTLAMYYEGQARASLGMLDNLFRALAWVPGRKTVVLTSAGVPVSDRAGGRPDVGELPIRLGEDVAMSDINLYTLFLDGTFLGRFAAENRQSVRNFTDLERDSEITGRWLDLFTGTAGGAFINVATGSGESSYERIVTETSAYYLLGVEPTAADRDGRRHEINVKVAQRGAIVRNRQFVLVSNVEAPLSLIGPDGEARGANAIGAAPDAGAMMRAAAAFMQVYPQSPQVHLIAGNLSDRIGKVRDPEQRLALAGSFRATFLDPADTDLVLPHVVDADLKLNRVDDAFREGAGLLTRHPQHLSSLIALALAGADLAKRQNLAYVTTSETYGLRAIAIIEGRERPANLDDQQWARMTTRGLAQLYQSVGVCSMVSGRRGEALTRLATSVDLNPRDPMTFLLLGTMANQEYVSLVDRYKVASAGPERDGALSSALAALDRVIDADAHVVALSGGDPGLKAVHDAVFEDLTSFFLYRHKTTDGLQTLIDNYKTSAGGTSSHQSQREPR